MGIFDGIVGPLVTQAANARGAYRQGQHEAQEDSLSNALLMRQLQRQDRQDNLAEALSKRRIEKEDRDYALREALSKRVPARIVRGADGEYYSVPVRVNPDGSPLDSDGMSDQLPVGPLVNKTMHMPDFTPK